MATKTKARPSGPRQIIEVDIDLIEEPTHLLRTVDENDPKFLDLVSSMKADGWWDSKPSEVTKDGNVYVIVDGLTKLYAARKALLKKAKVVVVDKMDEIDRLARSITANATVVETRPVEYGRALQKIMEERKGWTFVDLAKHVRKNEAWIQSRLALTGLEGPVAELVNKGDISIANAQALVKLQRAGVKLDEQILDRAQREPSAEFVPDCDALRKRSKGPVLKVRQTGDIKGEYERAKRDKKTKPGYLEALAWCLQQDPVSLEAKAAAKK